VNALEGDGGGPSISVRMRWISRSIFSLVAASEDLRIAGSVEVEEEARERRRRASSRSLVVMRRSIEDEFIAL